MTDLLQRVKAALDCEPEPTQLVVANLLAEMYDELTRATKQRDELLAVMTKIAEYPNEENEWQAVEFFTDIREEARAAIASVKDKP